MPILSSFLCKYLIYVHTFFRVLKSWCFSSFNCVSFVSKLVICCFVSSRVKASCFFLCSLSIFCRSNYRSRTELVSHFLNGGSKRIIIWTFGILFIYQIRPYLLILFMFLFLSKPFSYDMGTKGIPSSPRHFRAFNHIEWQFFYHYPRVNTLPMAFARTCTFHETKTEK